MDDRALAQILELGFEVSKARKALRKNKMDVERAVTWLCENESYEPSEDSEVEEKRKEAVATLIEFIKEDKIEEFKSLYDSLQLNIKYSSDLFVKAAGWGRLGIVIHLLSVEKDINDIKYKTDAFQAACRHDQFDMVRYLWEAGADASARDTEKKPTLYFTCQAGHVRIAEYLINVCKVDVDDRWHNSFSPLFIACQEDFLDVVKILVLGKCDINLPSASNATPLYIACQKGHYDIAKYLLNNGADMEIRFQHEYTPLYICCEKGWTQLARLLIDRGCNVETTAKGFTPMYVASQKGWFDIVKYMLDNGADKDHKYQDRWRPYDIAKTKGMEDTRKLLQWWDEAPTRKPKPAPKPDKNNKDPQRDMEKQEKNKDKDLEEKRKARLQVLESLLRDGTITAEEFQKRKDMLSSKQT